MTKGVQMRAAADGAPTLALMGDVGWDITPAGVSAALKGAGKGPITISLHSYGGDALAGVAIHNIIARHPGAKTVVVEGVAASAASLIAMAGDRIVMPDNALMMIHEAWGGAIGDATTMREQADVLDLVSGAYRKTYAAKTGKPEEEIAALMAADTWFTAEQAVAQGFATETAPPVEVRAMALPEGRFSKVPEALAAFCTITPPAEPVPLEEVRVTETVVQAAVETVVPKTAVVPALASLADLRQIAERGDLGAEWVLAQAEAGVTLDVARDAAIDAVAAKARVAPVRSVVVTRDEGDTFRAQAAVALSDTVVSRAPSAEAGDLRGLTLLGLGREILARAGERNVHRLTNDQVASRVLAAGSHTTSDFSGVLANSLNKTVRDLYAAMPNNWAGWCEEVEVDDFKTITASNIGQFPEPVEMVESGPVTLGTVGEESETYAVKERGRLFKVSRQAIVNDDTRALQRMAQGAALGGYTALRRAVFGVLTTNAAMADTIALFNASHSNLGTAGALDSTKFSELYQLLCEQTGPSRTGQSPTAAPLPPPTSVALIVAPQDYRTALELVSNIIVPTTAGSALPMEYRQMTSVIMDPFLNTGNDPYYMARTEPGMRALEIAYLRGGRTPAVTSAEVIEHTGVTYRVMFDFGVKAVTWRTIAGNLG
jgi:ATP-dependent protease ClpP protease subunit